MDNQDLTALREPVLRAARNSLGMGLERHHLDCVAPRRVSGPILLLTILELWSVFGMTLE